MSYSNTSPRSHSFFSKSLWYFILICLCSLFIGFLIGFRLIAWDSILPALKIDFGMQQENYFQQYMQKNMPVFALAKEKEEEKESSFFPTMAAAVFNPQSFWPGIGGVIERKEIAEQNNAIVNPSGNPQTIKPMPTILKGDKDYPPIGIYCTHNAESYRPTTGVDKEEGKNGAVFLVAQELQKELNEYGFTTILIDTIHDYPDWNKSYANSLASIQQLKEQYPDMELFIDVHRDAFSENSDKSITTTTINGVDVAKIMFVVGTNHRAEHPNWEKNLAFANQIADCLKEYYPDLVRQVKVQSGRYNQHIADKAILVEMGSNENTLEEAKRAAKILADGIALVLTQEIEQKTE